jgi:glycerol dehydrogenase
MNIKAVFPGKYVQGQGVLNELPEYISLFGHKSLLLASPSVQANVLPQFGKKRVFDTIQVERFNGECCEEEISRILCLIKDKHMDVVIGMGGGKTIDTAKIAADRAGIPVIIVPTIASTDAPCSGCAVIYTKKGEFESVYYQKMNPSIVLVDMDVISKAPVRFLVSGMGDALSTWFEAKSCEMTQSMNECGGLGTKASYRLARLCYDILLKYGVQAMKDNEAHKVTPSLNDIAEATILLSGLGFESSGLAAAHSIHNGLTALEETHAYFHGEKVAFGVLAGLQLSEEPNELVSEVYAFCEMVGLPTTLADIGLIKPDRNYLMKAAEKACAPDSPIHHEVGAMTADKVLESMIKADEIGTARKCCC